MKDGKPPARQDGRIEVGRKHRNFSFEHSDSAEPLSSQRLRRFPLCALGVLCGKKFVSIRVHSWFKNL